MLYFLAGVIIVDTKVMKGLQAVIFEFGGQSVWASKECFTKQQFI